jgi:hypothetical protein
MRKILISIVLILMVSLALNIYQYSKFAGEPNHSVESIRSLLLGMPLDSLWKTIHGESSQLQYVYVDSNLISTYPDFNVNEEPPISIKTAIALSKKALIENVDDSLGWKLEYILLEKGFSSLGKFYKDKWCYMVNYSKNKEPKFYPFQWKNVTIPVYFAGVRPLKK